ncbi:MAG TPA: hypothetical protein VG096_07165 [Bryobacteraceae bacterium]|nr:hypothetical protein [Bryobacteraceae bacterium]
MRRALITCWLSFSAVLFFARGSFGADPLWQSKPVAQWNEEDAKAVLADSPWVKHFRPEHVRDLSPDERRDGGNMEAGIGRGVGLEGLAGLFSGRREAEAVRRAHDKPPADPVVVRWESAPVRAAETKAGEDAPAVDASYYVLVVYDIPLPRRWNLANELKGVSYLKLGRKKELKPARVEILRGDDGLATVVYLFRRSVEITRQDRYIYFVAQLDRLFLAPLFNVEDMRLAGRLEL